MSTAPMLPPLTLMRAYAEKRALHERKRARKVLRLEHASGHGRRS